MVINHQNVLKERVDATVSVTLHRQNIDQFQDVNHVFVVVCFDERI